LKEERNGFSNGNNSIIRTEAEEEAEIETDGDAMQKK